MRDEYYCLILKNEIGRDVSGVYLWLDQDSENQAKISVGVVSLKGEDISGLPIPKGAIEETFIVQRDDPLPTICVGNYTQRIFDPYTAPYGVAFEDYNNENRGVIGKMKDGEELGIWLKRSINRDRAREVYNGVAEKIPGSRLYRKIEKNNVENAKFNLVWK